jgi:hypothetical protein
MASDETVIVIEKNEIDREIDNKIGKDEIYKDESNKDESNKDEFNEDEFNEDEFNEDEFNEDEFNKEFNKGKPHNGNPISMVEISQERKYLVTYSKDDDSIVRWEIGEGEGDKSTNGDDIKQVIEPISKINDVNHIFHMCVSDTNDKYILAYIYANDANDVGMSISK